MTDREEQVRRLLADARHDEPVPADVAARLDAVLARLAAEESDPANAPAGDSSGEPAAAALAPAEAVTGPTTGSADVTPLRRRPWGGILLVAAAAVAVAAVGFGQVERGGEQAATSATDTSGGREAEAGAASQAQPPDATALSGPAEAQSESGSTQVSPAHPLTGADADATLDERYAASGGVLPEIRADHFAGDVRTALEQLARSTALGAPSPRSGAAVPAAPAFPCDPAAWGEGTLLPVTYEGASAVLALRPPTGDSQVADLLRCGTAEVIRSVTLPVG